MLPGLRSTTFEGMALPTLEILQTYCKKTYLKFDVIITRCGRFHLPTNFVIHNVIKAENFLRFFVVQISVFPGSSVWIKLVLQYKIMDRLVRKTILGNLFTITSTMTEVSFFLIS